MRHKQIIYWVRLNYATTHHDPPWPTTIHYHPPPAKIHSPSPTTNHQPKYMHHHRLPHTTSQNTSTNTYCFLKNGPPRRKSQNKFIYNFLLALQCCFPWRRFCVTKFWSVRFSSSKFLLIFRSSHRRCSVRIGVLNILTFRSSQENTCAWRLFLNKVVGRCLQLY